MSNAESGEPQALQDFKVTFILAEYASVSPYGPLVTIVNGFLKIIPSGRPYSMVVRVDTPWAETNVQHKLRIRLLDEDYQEVLFPDASGNSTNGFELRGALMTSRPLEAKRGSRVSVAMPMNVPGLPCQPGNYLWKAYINERSHEDWEQPFMVVAAQPVGPHPLLKM